MECDTSEEFFFGDVISSEFRRLFLIAEVINVVVNLVKRLPPYHD